jgi:hypothetical protein
LYGIMHQKPTSTPQSFLEPEPDFFQDLSSEARDYIEFLEDELEASIEKVDSGRKAIETFIEILSFISDNFGTTADFPVRIDNDFYKEVFQQKLIDCLEYVNEFKEGGGDEESEL